MHHARDTIVIGASSGGPVTLRRLIESLPAQLPATLIIVQHRASVGGDLSAMLSGVGSMPATEVRETVSLELGRIYIAAPDLHLVCHDGKLLPMRGARENRARPSINVSMRTAAAERNSRVIGVLLTGNLDDGAAGLRSIERCGGTIIVQDPNEAEYPDMPRHALEVVESAIVLPLEGIAEALVNLAGSQVEWHETPEDITIEASLNGPQGSDPERLGRIGAQVPLACPDCAGSLWQLGQEPAVHYRCHTGHAHTPRSLVGGQVEEVERSMWAAVRALSEQATILEHLANRAEQRNANAAAEFRARAEEARVHSEQARKFLLSLRLGIAD